MFILGSVFISILPLITGQYKNINELFIFILLAILFAYLSYKNFKLSKESKEEERIYAPNINATQIEQINFYKRYIYISLVAFPILSFFIISELNDLESGRVQSVSIWGPVSFIYQQFGYWPAILFVPILGFISITVFIYKIRKNKN